MLIQVIYFVYFILYAQADYSPIKIRTQNISQGCWIIDSNNLTEIGMSNCVSEVYFVELGIGTPPQKLNFHIDTLRELIWLPVQSKFKINESQTFQITNETTATIYNQKLVHAKNGSQIISIDNTSIQTRTPVAWSESINFVFPEIIDGVLGLGFSQTPNFLDNAYRDNQIKSPIYALQMRSHKQQSIIYYNDIPQSIVSTTIYVPVKGKSSWKVKLDSIKVGNIDYSYISSKSMILDSSTSLLYLNPKLYKKFIEQYFNNCDVVDSHLMCLCGQYYPDIRLVLENLVLNIQPKDYLIRTENKNKCSVLIGQTKYENSSILVGSLLMKNYVVTFDKYQKRIGFTGDHIGIWSTIFYICEYATIGLMMILIGFGFYMLWDVKVKKSSKQSQKKKSKIKKGKKVANKPQISLTFLEY